MHFGKVQETASVDGENLILTITGKAVVSRYLFGKVSLDKDLLKIDCSPVREGGDKKQILWIEGMQETR